MTQVIAIDPGPERSALVFLQDDRPVYTLLDENEMVRIILRDGRTRMGKEGIALNGADLVVEMVESFGMPVGREVFETVYWIGRFCECWHGECTRLPRRAVKMHHCHSNRANDAAIRQALLDRYGPGRQKAIGTKHAQGPLYHIKQDLWSALALGLTYLETQAQREIA